jgi:hypothetical protein
MAGKIDLNAYNFGKPKADYRSGTILKKVKQKQDTKKANQVNGLVSAGTIDVTQAAGGISWSISRYIDFPYVYINRPIFTWGLDGTAGIDWSAGDNQYSSNLPNSIRGHTLVTFQPAIFIPRIIHWNMVQGNFLGCHLLVAQVNPNCTETDKTIRLHYRFEGTGHKKNTAHTGSEGFTPSSGSPA